MFNQNAFTENNGAYGLVCQLQPFAWKQLYNPPKVLSLMNHERIAADPTVIM